MSELKCCCGTARVVVVWRWNSWLLIMVISQLELVVWGKKLGVGVTLLGFPALGAYLYTDPGMRAGVRGAIISATACFTPRVQCA